MANNRLYIGDKETLEYLMIEKTYDISWDVGYFDLKKYISLKKFLETRVNESKKTNLILFTEYDSIYDDFMKKGTDLKDI